MAGELLQRGALDQPGVGKFPGGELAVPDQSPHRFRMDIQALGGICYRDVVFKTLAHTLSFSRVILLYDAT
jgi:hypothetical protein